MKKCIKFYISSGCKNVYCPKTMMEKSMDPFYLSARNSEHYEWEMGHSLRRISEGGQAWIDEVNFEERKVARKVLFPPANVDPNDGTWKSRCSRFRREVDILNSLKHPDIMPIIASGEYKLGEYPMPAYCMPLAAYSLEQYCSEKDRRNNYLENLIHYLHEALRGLAFIHAKDIIHRDIKPDNILIGDSNKTWIGDFGFANSSEHDDREYANLTKTNFIAGTQGYMAPEQAMSLRSAGKFSDVYSFGVLLFRCLSPDVTNPLFSPKDRIDRIKSLSYLTEDFKDFIIKCTELDYVRRFGDAGEAYEEFMKLARESRLDIRRTRLKYFPEEHLTAVAEIVYAGGSPYFVAEFFERIASIAKDPGMIINLLEYIDYRRPNNLFFEKAVRHANFGYMQSAFKNFHSYFVVDNSSFSYVDEFSCIYRMFVQELIKYYGAQPHPDSEIWDFIVFLAKGILDKSVQLNRFQGGREFVRCFGGGSELELQLLDSILVGMNSDSIDFLQDVDISWCHVSKAVEAKVNERISRPWL